MTTTPTTTIPTVGKPLAVGYALTGIAAGVLLELSGILPIIGGLVLLVVGIGLIALVADAVEGTVAKAGATIALVLLAAAGASFITLAAWPGLLVLAVHGTAAVLASRKA